MLDRGEVAEQIARRRTDIEEDELHQSEKEQERDCAEGNDRSDDLIFCQDRGETTDRQIKHPQQQKNQISAPVGAGRISRGLVCDSLKQDEIKRRWHPKNDVEKERTEKL